MRFTKLFAGCVMSVAMIISSIPMCAAAVNVKITETDMEAVFAGTYWAGGEAYIAVRTANGEQLKVYDKNMELTPYKFSIDEWGDEVALSTDVVLSYENEVPVYRDLDGNVVQELTWEKLFGNVVPADTPDYLREISSCSAFEDGRACITTMTKTNAAGSFDGISYIVDTKGNVLYSIDTVDYSYVNYIGGGLYVIEVYNEETEKFHVDKIFDINGKEVDVAAINAKLAAKGFGDMEWILSESEGYRIAEAHSLEAADNDECTFYLDENFDIVLGPLPVAFDMGTGEYSYWGYYAPMGEHIIVNDMIADVFEGKLELKNHGTVAVANGSNDQWGYVDKQGKVVIPAEYDAAYGCGNDLFAVQKDGKCGFVDTNNQVVVPFEYDDISVFYNGTACGMKNGKVVIFSLEDSSALGDINGDGLVDATDASEVLIEYSAMSTTKEHYLTEAQISVADVNGDGMIDATDATSILSYYAYASTADPSQIAAFEEWIKNT